MSLQKVLLKRQSLLGTIGGGVPGAGREASGAAGSGAGVGPSLEEVLELLTQQGAEAGAEVGGEPGITVPVLAAGALGAVGLGAAVAPLGVAYLASQMIGVQYPWETGPGEGFIAPWSRDIVQDESGRWVTRETRPDLFAAAPGVPGVQAGRQLGMRSESQVVKTWMAGTWQFWKTADGKIHTYTKDGVLKSWRPKKHIVLPRGSTTLSQAVKAQKFLDRLWGTVARKTKALKRA